MPTREPHPRLKAPRCPEYVEADPVALKTWKHYLPILRRMRVLTEADGMVLANLCLIHSQLIVLLEKVRQLNQGSQTGIAGMVIATKTGYLAENQIFADLKSAMQQELNFCRELGLTPSARARMSMEPEKAKTKGGLLTGQWKPERKPLPQPSKSEPELREVVQ